MSDNTRKDNIMSDNNGAKNLKRYIFPAFVCLLCIVIVAMAVSLKQSMTQNENMQPLIDSYKQELETYKNEVKRLKDEIDKQAEIETETIAAELKSICELSTAEQIMYDLYTYIENEGNLFKEKRFSMLYRADIKAGINFENFDFASNIVISDNEVIITIPQASVLSIQIDPNSIQFYDEKNSIFNHANKDDAVSAQKDAYSKLEARIETDEMFIRLLEKASENTKLFIESMIQPMIGERKPIINFQ